MILNEIIEYNLQQLFGLEYLRECLELRIKLSKENYSNKTELQKNEIDILYYQTKNNINKISKNIQEKKAEIKDLFTIYFQELEDKTNKNKNGNNSLLNNSQ
jgi:hypothetical protein